MRTKIIIIALGIAVLYWGRNLILERLKSQEEWQKKRLHKGAEAVKKFAADGIIGEDSSVDNDSLTESIHDEM